MRFNQFDDRTIATRDEIEMRLLTSLWNDPRCRDVKLEVIDMPRNARGVNWTVSLENVPAYAVFETADIVHDIQNAYELAA